MLSKNAFWTSVYQALAQVPASSAPSTTASITHAATEVRAPQ